MAFELKDLVKARFWYKDYFQLLADFDLSKPYYALVHYKRNRLITIARYKKTIKLLSNLENLQPYYNINDPKVTEILATNTYMVYDVELIMPRTPTRWTVEKRSMHTDCLRVPISETWQHSNSLSPEEVVSLRLKSAALDILYEILNTVRSTLTSDILLDEHIYNNRYKQAVDYLNNVTVNTGLLEVYARQMNTDMTNAAKHFIFCYNEDLMKITKNEQQLIIFEDNILAANSLSELQEILLEWHYQNLCYL